MVIAAVVEWTQSLDRRNWASSESSERRNRHRPHCRNPEEKMTKTREKGSVPEEY